MIRAVALALLCAACAPQTPVRGDSGRICNAGGLSALVGKPYTNALGERAKRLSGSGAVRVLRPGMMVTMDYRVDRLDASVDDANIVTGFKCG
ncbi:hypothetical protein BH09PSE4_BH09PSE4_15060 [soil metagenome]